MKIGYPCINRSIGCTSAKTFRLGSYSEQRLIETVSANLDCLGKILKYNLENRLLFFRITSDLVPFASHTVNRFDWQSHFRAEFKELGCFIKQHDFRISMHPDQFVLINSPNKEVQESSLRELKYHAEVLDLLGLDSTAKIQIHVGGVYADKTASIQRFVSRYSHLPDSIRKRLVIENDDRLFSVKDCLLVYRLTGIPVLFDSFHHEVNNSGESSSEAFKLTASTWEARDGVPMVDYSSQAPGAKKGKHVESIEPLHFKSFIEATAGYDFDVMLEIKDKEKSALIAASLINA